jgi:phosphoribosylaminoimidazole (AIR) synthetase
VVKASDAKNAMATFKRSGEKVVTLGSVRRRKGDEPQVAVRGSLTVK